MRIKKLGAALVVVVALGAVLANSSFAGAVTNDIFWKSKTVVGNTIIGVPVPIASRQLSATAVFETHSGGFALKLSGTGISCVECTIENSGGSAIGHGKLRFTGVTVVEPSTCSVASTLTTNELKLLNSYRIGTARYILFEPSTGPENGFITMSLAGASCPIKTAIIPKGTVFVKAQNAAGVYAVEQQVNSSPAINSAAGGTLHVGEESASLTGEVAFDLIGEHEGQEFGSE